MIPHFDYASSVWSKCFETNQSHHDLINQSNPAPAAAGGPKNETNQSHLQILHNRLARTILSVDMKTPIDDMFNSLKWIRLCDRWSNHMLILIFKCINMCPDYL